ncbi:MAG: tRNA (adenosine(37)-N6)-threonylcarbamoyltransferase complex transferase subunit TsaD, partial [Chlorobi bacterium]|nr:tRNA (adenosine(37)-N6)-threonylcarbamoyltransferase complex transferase subunit TsaD [Chlorobiota bacterium]
MLVLGIESSCDETSAAVIRNGALLSNVISSQLFHARFGGVVPELASREHLRTITSIVQKALDDANITDRDVELCAATSGPGLIGSLLVGLNFGKGFALSHDIPFVAVHHLEAHIFSAFLEQHDLSFPFITLIVSGGHTLLYLVRSFR